MATQTGSIDLKAAKQAHDDAEKVATNYVTDITNGIMVHPENDSTTGWRIADALELLKDGGTYIKAWLSGTNDDIPTVEIGQSAEGNVLIDNDSIDIRDGATTLATFGGDGAQIGVPDAGTNILIQPSGMTIRNGLDEKAIFSDELFSIGDANGRVEFTPTKTTFYGNNGQEIVVFGHGMSTNGVFEQKLITNPTIYNETPCTVFDGRLDYEPVSDLELNATINGNDISITIPDDQDYTGVTDGLDVTYIAQTRELDAIWRGSMQRTNEYEWSTTATKTQPVTKKLAFDPISGTEIKVQDSGLLSSGNYVTFIAGTSATKTISVSFLGTAIYTVTYDGNKTITIAWKSGQDNTLFTSISYYREGVNVAKFTATYEREYRSPIFSFGSNKIDGTKAYTMLVGEGLEPRSNHQLIVGKYNAASYGGIVLGNGTSDDDRSNAFEVISNGNVFTKGSLYLNNSKEIYLNWDELLTYDETKIYASDYNNTNNLYLQADGYQAFYVGDANTAPDGKMYLYTDRLDLNGNFRLRNSDRIILNKNQLTNYDQVAVFAGISGSTNNLYLQADGYMGFVVGNTTTAPAGRMYLYYGYLDVYGYTYSRGGYRTNNAQYYYGRNTGGNDRLVCGINSNNDYVFGRGSYDNNEGTVYYDGNAIHIRSKAAIAVNGTAFRPASGNSVPCGTTTYYWTRFYANTAEWVKSDRKAKDVLGDLDFSEDLIMNLKPVQFMLKDSDHRRIHMGFIAQEANDVAKKIDKNLSFIIADYTDPDKGEYLGEDVNDEELTWGLSYTELIAPTIKVVQDQQRKIDKLERRIEQLEKEV